MFAAPFRINEILNDGMIMFVIGYYYNKVICSIPVSKIWCKESSFVSFIRKLISLGLCILKVL